VPRRRLRVDIVVVAAMKCTRCSLYPRMERNLCGACLGRELLGFGSREEHTAAIRAEYQKARGRTGGVR